MTQLYIWRLEQNENNGWDTYDSCVVVSESEEKAKKIHPSHYDGFDDEKNEWYEVNNHGEKYYMYRSSQAWASHPNNVSAVKVGIADTSLGEGYIICSSFNAG